jgi:prolipoprotein diacylglyceryl transferase
MSIAYLASIPSPSEGVWHIGALPIRGYALCIIAGVIAAVWIGDRRWVARGGRPGTVGDIAVWAVPFGLVGGRLYHVLTDPELYFGEGKSPITALYIWRGGLGLWGAIALGALGAYIGCKRRGIRFPAFADALAPGIVIAQAIGRWGNWFNQELYGKPTDLPWGLEIDKAHRESGYLDDATFQPIFLYEFLWDLGVAGLVLWADRRFKLGHGRVFALYVMAYTAGRGWIEMLRIDTVNHIFGLRLNVWTSVILFILSTVYFVVVGRKHPGREDPATVEPRHDDEDAKGNAGADGDEDAKADRDGVDEPDEPDDTGESAGGEKSAGKAAEKKPDAQPDEKAGKKTRKHAANTSDEQAPVEAKTPDAPDDGLGKPER